MIGYQGPQGKCGGRGGALEVPFPLPPGRTKWVPALALDSPGREFGLGGPRFLSASPA